MKDDRFRKKKFILINILTIVNEGLSLMIVSETTKFIKTVVFEKYIVIDKYDFRHMKTIMNVVLHATLSNVVLHADKKLWGAKTS